MVHLFSDFCPHGAFSKHVYEMSTELVKYCVCALCDSKIDVNVDVHTDALPSQRFTYVCYCC